MMGGGISQLAAYSVDADLWTNGKAFDPGIARNLAAQVSPFQAIGVTSGTRSTGGITTVNLTPTAGGTNYVVGDILTCSTGGTGGKVIVTSINPGGIVTGIKLLACGSGYTTGTGKATTGGSGTSCTVEITAISVVGRVVTAMSHFFKVGETVTMSGATDANWNGQFTILGVDSLTGFDIAISAASSATAASTQSTTVLVDSTKNWSTNEHVGKLVRIAPAGVSGLYSTRRITANTATTLTLQSAITAATNGTSRYIIQDVMCHGADIQTPLS